MAKVIPTPAGLDTFEFAAELLAAVPALTPTLGGTDDAPELVRKLEIDASGAVTVPDALEGAALAVAARYTNEATLRDRAETSLANLQAAWDGWAGLTAAQKDAALKLNVRVTIALVRLALRKLDQT